MNNPKEAYKRTYDELFVCESKSKEGNKIYIVKRHFTGKRSLREAIYEVIKNEYRRKAT